MEVGGFSVLPEEEVWGLLGKVCSSTFFQYPLIFSLFSLQSSYLSLILLVDFCFSFQGLNLLTRASALWEEAQQLEAEGLWKIESAVSGSEAEGFYRLLWGAVSHTSSSPALPPPKKTSSCPSCDHFPATLSGAQEGGTWSFWSCGREREGGTRSPLPSIIKGSRGDYPCPYATPLP